MRHLWTYSFASTLLLRCFVSSACIFLIFLSQSANNSSSSADSIFLLQPGTLEMNFWCSERKSRPGVRIFKLSFSLPFITNVPKSFFISQSFQKIAKPPNSHFPHSCTFLESSISRIACTILLLLYLNQMESKFVAFSCTIIKSETPVEMRALTLASGLRNVLLFLERKQSETNNILKVS